MVVQEFHAADAPIRHRFFLSHKTSIYHSTRCMSRRDNEIVREEINKMLEAGIIVPADSSWSFPVVIVTK